ncbi:MAG: hypothetical protein AB7P02_29660 [Alphaproteobacteria bacterium]
MSPTALLCADVLGRAPVRNLLLRLAVQGLFRARWTDAAQAEWIAGALAAQPGLSPAALGRVRVLMEAALPDARVAAPAPMMPGLDPAAADEDPIAAAAARAGADTVVTWRQDPATARVLVGYGIELCDPDTLVLDLADADPTGVAAAMRACRLALRRPETTPAEYLATLERGGLPGIAAFFADRAEAI